MNVRILVEAEAEIEAARQYLNEQSSSLGSRLLDELTSTLESISAQPLSFPKLETVADELPYRRAMLPTFKFLVVFEILAKEITVVAVAHASRAPNYWIGRSI